MIISRTPLRVSLMGGGSDLPSYYRESLGRVVSFTINQFVYVLVNHRFEDSLRVSYSKTEIVDSVDHLEHDLIRECLREFHLSKGVEVVTVSDVPSRGTGLGSSSSITVGTIHALSHHTHQNIFISPCELARLACTIEIDRCQKRIGKQDQYICSLGGIQDIQFYPDDSVSSEEISCRDYDLIESSLLLVYTGQGHHAEEILSQGLDANGVSQLVDLVPDMIQAIQSSRIQSIGRLLDESWKIKRSLSKHSTNDHVDDIYQKAIQSGAIGGKLLGAGNGGFLLLCIDPEERETLKQKLSPLKTLAFSIERKGSCIYDKWS